LAAWGEGPGCARMATRICWRESARRSSGV
jgi:hypothetical protein